MTSIALDASSSAVQIAAMLSKDLKTAMSSNLTASTDKNSMYKVIANAANAKLKAAAKAKVPAAMDALNNRFTFEKANCKTAVISTTYSASQMAAVDSFRKAVKNKYAFDPSLKTTSFLAAILWDSISENMEAVLKVINWFSDALTKISAESKETKFYITLPNSKKFLFMINKTMKKKQIEVDLFDDVTNFVATEEETDKFDLTEATRLVASQFIQSFDAALAELIVCKLDAQNIRVSVNMDSFEVNEKYKDTLIQAARESYFELFSEKDWMSSIRLELEAQSSVKLDAFAPTDDFDISEVLQSNYLVS